MLFRSADCVSQYMYLVLKLLVLTDVAPTLFPAQIQDGPSVIVAVSVKYEDVDNAGNVVVIVVVCDPTNKQPDEGRVVAGVAAKAPSWF